MKHTSNVQGLFQRVCMGGAIATTTVLSLLSPALSPSVYASLHDSPKAVLDEAWQIVNREYVDGDFNQVDWQAVRQDLLSRNYTSTQQAYEALREALQQLEDPYTRFMDVSQYQTLTNQTSGELSGVGIRLQLHPDTGALTVVEPLENSPATRAGIVMGDRILAIDGQSTEGMSVSDASNLIRGEVGTRITLRLERGSGEAFDVPLTRARIELPTVRYSIKQEGNTRLGYIRLAEFSAHASQQMRDAIQALSTQDVDAFVLDLRGNPGGLLQASIDISRMWIDRGSIVRTVDRIGSSEEIMANHTAMTDLPLAVLVDGNSASSSEILTGALMDNRRATIIGTQTYGKALVQSVHSLSDGSGLAVTIAHYYTPNGTDISHLGITPDIRVDLTAQQRQTLAANPGLVATQADPQYSRAASALESTVLANRTNISPVQRVSVDREQLQLPSN